MIDIIKKFSRLDHLLRVFVISLCVFFLSFFVFSEASAFSEWVRDYRNADERNTSGCWGMTPSFDSDIGYMNLTSSGGTSNYQCSNPMQGYKYEDLKKRGIKFRATLTSTGTNNHFNWTTSSYNYEALGTRLFAFNTFQNLADEFVSGGDYYDEWITIEATYDWTSSNYCDIDFYINGDLYWSTTADLSASGYNKDTLFGTYDYMEHYIWSTSGQTTSVDIMWEYVSGDFDFEYDIPPIETLPAINIGHQYATLGLTADEDWILEKAQDIDCDFGIGFVAQYKEQPTSIYFPSCVFGSSPASCITEIVANREYEYWAYWTCDDDDIDDYEVDLGILNLANKEEFKTRASFIYDPRPPDVEEESDFFTMSLPEYDPLSFDYIEEEIEFSYYVDSERRTFQSYNFDFYLAYNASGTEEDWIYLKLEDNKELDFGITSLFSRVRVDSVVEMSEFEEDVNYTFYIFGIERDSVSWAKTFFGHFIFNITTEEDEVYIERPEEDDESGFAIGNQVKSFINNYFNSFKTKFPFSWVFEFGNMFNRVNNKVRKDFDGEYPGVVFAVNFNGQDYEIPVLDFESIMEEDLGGVDFSAYINLFKTLMIASLWVSFMFVVYKRSFSFIRRITTMES
jgi:hypothetical protein